MENDDTFKLPKTLYDLSKISYLRHEYLERDDDIGTDVDPDDDTKFRAERPCEFLIHKYSINGGLKRGRPLNSALVLTTGASGSGKTSTINALFFGKVLCPTEKYESTTKTVQVIRRDLIVPTETRKISSSLGFIDVPGIHGDTDGKDKEHVQAIKKIKYDCPELRYRYGLKAFKMVSNLNIDYPLEVYPNVVLFMVNAMDKKIKGDKSNFVKTLKEFDTCRYIDKERNNLIVVLTHILHSVDEDEVLDTIKEMTAIIKQLVQKHLGIVDVPVVPVENVTKKKNGTDKLPKVGDFYELPNGEINHLNLFEAMIKTVDKNRDYLGKLLISWYFSLQSGQEEEIGQLEVKVLSPEELGEAEENFSDALEENNLELAAEVDEDELKGFDLCKSIADDLPPTMVKERQLRLESIGHGYSPVKEEICQYLRLVPGGVGHQLVMVDSWIFSIPSNISFIEAMEADLVTMSAIRCTTFEDKMQYEEHLRERYGLSLKRMIVQVSSTGRWISDTENPNGITLVTFVSERELGRLTIRDPKLTKAFSKALATLPDTCKENNYDQFIEFFSCWGTHLVVGHTLGGAVYFDCSVLNKSVRELGKIGGILSRIFQCLWTSDSNWKEESGNGIEQLLDLGVTEVTLRFEGGESVRIRRLEDLSPEDLQKWATSVASNPKELAAGIKLEPFYNFSPSDAKRKSLREATLDYLGDCGDFKPKKSAIMAHARSNEFKREVIGKEQVRKTTEIPAPKPKDEGSCFPKGSLVALATGQVIEVERLRHTSGYLTTLTKPGRPVATKFCTFLHFEENTLFDYIKVRCSNGKELTASPGHLVFKRNSKLETVQMRDLCTGDKLVYHGDDGKVETTTIIEITAVRMEGAYCPLTMAGTMIVDGFFVTSYADINSFGVAQVVMLPLKMTSILKPKINMPTGIPEYAKFLMKIRQDLSISC